MDIKLNFIEKGKGTPFILLHGNGENNSYFINQINYFSNKYRVIAVDTRGHGATPRGVKAFTIRQFAEDLLCFMDEQGIEKADILGFSDGGNIALVFAVKYPQRVGKLIINGANLNTKGVRRRFQIPIEIMYRIYCIFAKRKAEMFRLMVRDPNIDPEELHNIHVRTLLIAGSKDMIKQKHTEAIYKSLPNAKLSIIKGDHFIASKNSEVFNRAVMDFLKEKRKNVEDV